MIPAGADKGVFLLAPLAPPRAALAAWAVIPVNEDSCGKWVVSDLNVGVLYLLAISSLGVYGVIMGGWASNSKYPFMGSLRSAAQMISYEVSLGFVVITVLLLVGSLNLTAIVNAQKTGLGTWLGLPGSFLDWYWVPLLPMFVVFFISSLAETNRPPFDLVEAESELVAGFMVEYCSTPYLLFMLGEYVAITTMCALAAILFMGGWLPPVDIWPLNGVPGIFWFAAKVVFMFFMFAMVKAIVPRYRYDQLMRLGWKVFLPLSLVMVVVVAGVLQFFDSRLRGPRIMVHRPRREIAVPGGVRLGVLPVDALLLHAEEDAELSVREGAALAALPRRACAAPLSERRGALHRLQALRGDLPGPGHHHRGGTAAQRRHPAHDPLRHRHGQVHLLRPLPGGLPGGCHRRRPEFRVRDRDARGALL